MKVVLITGGAGFLGSHLCEKFLEEGYCVVAVDNFSTGTKENVRFLEEDAVYAPNFIFIHADVIDPWGNWLKEIPESWLAQIKYVLHFASPASPVHYQNLNIETMMANSVGLKNALDFANTRNARLVLASTSEIYGNPQLHPQPERYWGYVNSFGERSCYTESKRFAEALIYSYNKKFSQRHGLVRIFNTYGPRMDLSDGRVVINSIRSVANDEPVIIHGNGSQTRSFCYVTDLVEAVFLYTQSQLTEPVNIGNPEEVSISHLVEAIYTLYPNRTKKIVYDDISAEDPLLRKPDIGKAKELLDWHPSISLHQGLQLFKNWFEGSRK